MTTALNSLDRCETCGAQAQLAAKVSGSWLMYCGHHGNKYETKLREVAEDWLDEREFKISYDSDLTATEEPVTVDS